MLNSEFNACSLEIFRSIKVSLVLFLLNWTSISEHKSLYLDSPPCVVSEDMKCSKKIEIKYILFMTNDLSSLRLHYLYVSAISSSLPSVPGFLVPTMSPDDHCLGPLLPLHSLQFRQNNLTHFFKASFEAIMRHFVLELTVWRGCPCARVHLVGPGYEFSPLFGRNMAIQEQKPLKS